MKVRLYFKTPDVIDYAVEELDGELAEKFKKICKKYIEYGECLTVEIDTEKETCEVVPL